MYNRVGGDDYILTYSAAAAQTNQSALDSPQPPRPPELRLSAINVGSRQR